MFHANDRMCIVATALTSERVYNSDNNVRWSTVVAAKRGKETKMRSNESHSAKKKWKFDHFIEFAWYHSIVSQNSVCPMIQA